MTYDEADRRCKSFDIGAELEDGNLATIDNDAKNAEISMLLELAYPLAKQQVGPRGK